MTDQNKKTPVAGLLLLMGTALVCLALDLWTKALSYEHFAAGTEYHFIRGYLHFTYVENPGAVFGLGKGWRWLFVLVSLAAIGFVAYLFTHSPRRWWHDLTLGMLLAGIMGNLYDRVALGYVRDMIHVFPRWPNLFPWVFNVADSLLCVSIAILLLAGILIPEPRREHESATQQS